jgi:cation:H+ antiporter
MDEAAGALGDGPAVRRQRFLAVALAAGVAVPALVVRFSSPDVAAWIEATLFGLAIVGAAFLLAWAAEVVQLDISAGLALALLALIAVLPEYAVDFVFAWKAGHDPTQAQFALANMTGANQILIGVGWSAVVLVTAYRFRAIRARGEVPRAEGGGRASAVLLDRSHAVEISFLLLATLYGLTLPLRRTLSMLDALVLVAIFGAYLSRIARAPAEEPHLVGPARAIATLPARNRRLVVLVLFVVAAGIILACAEHFAEAIISTGEELGVDQFLLVKWVAPLASEAPEFVIAILFAWRLNANSALGALVSSKVNQWTLLVGTLPIVYAVSAMHLHGLPIDAVQREELWVTATQSAFALAVLANRSMSVREALVISGLFLTQFVSSWALPPGVRGEARILIGVIYLVAAFGVVLRERAEIRRLLHDGLRAPYDELARP